jgi:hypothetical protein
MITGLLADRRQAARQQRSQSIAQAPRIWAEQTLPKLWRKIRTGQGVPLQAVAVEGAVAMSR